MRKISLVLFFLMVSLPAMGKETTGRAVFHACLQSEEVDGSHAGIINCMFDALAGYEEKLQRVSDKVRKKIEDKGSEYHSKSKDDPEMETLESFDASREAFELYLDKECDRARRSVFPGNAGVEAEVMCKITLISERLEHLI